MAANPYDPVTTTDTTHLTDDDWSLPPLRYNQFSGTSRFKTRCSSPRAHKGKIMISIVAFLVISVLTIIIYFSVAANNDTERHPTGEEGKWENNELGLVFYPKPEDGSIVISFSPEKFVLMVPQPIEKSLQGVVENYNVLHQVRDSFTKCNVTYNPFNQTCVITNTIFGSECTQERKFGYNGGQPCVLVQLNLPDNVTIKPISNASHLWDEAKTVVGQQPDRAHIPFTCKGTEPIDTKILESVSGYSAKHERITYSPPEGLYSYIYRQRNTSLPLLKPAVMVQFTSLVSKKKVHITCTAWGQLYDSRNEMLNHKLLTTQFVLYVNH